MDLLYKPFMVTTEVCRYGLDVILSLLMFYLMLTLFDCGPAARGAEAAEFSHVRLFINKRTFAASADYQLIETRFQL